MALSPDDLSTDLFGIGLSNDRATNEGLLTSEGESIRLCILDAAVELAARGGYRAVELRQIASSVGVSVHTVLRHFASPVLLLMKVLGDELVYFDDHARRTFDGAADPFDRLRSAIALLLKEMQSSDGVTEALTHAYAAAHLVAAPQVEGIRRQTTDIFARLLNVDVDGDHRRLIAEVLTDVWTSEVIALVQERRTYTEMRQSLDTAIDMLTRNASLHDARSS